jgi:hypothetical protein
MCNKERLECSWGFDNLSLIALERNTFFHKGADVMFHAFPEKEKFDMFICFLKT